MSNAPRKNTMSSHLPTATRAWLWQLDDIFKRGRPIAPRGKKTIEILHSTFRCSMENPVLYSPKRSLSFKFLAGEAMWILAGDDTVAGIAPYNQHISQFSDDQVSFFGAYGPRINAQLDYVLNKLLDDRETRQAVLTTWRPNPPKTKDVPCTIALGFSIRDDRLSCHAFMRSSDVWLGLPYDVFNFSMVAAKLACFYNMSHSTDPVALGDLYLTMASSHLYEENYERARACIDDELDNAVSEGTSELSDLVIDANWNGIETALLVCRDKIEINVPKVAWRIRPK